MESLGLRPRQQFPIIPLIIVLILAISGSFGIWKLVQKKGNSQVTPVGQETVDTGVVTPEAPLSHEEIAARYNASLHTTASEIQAMNTANKDELISAAEDKLLAVRVPGTKKDVFIQTFFTLDKMKQDQVTPSETVKTKILELINSLVSSV